MDDSGEEDLTGTVDGAYSELYDVLQSIPVEVEGVTFDGKYIETHSRAFERTVVQIHGDGYTGFGEDTDPSIEAHERLRTEGLPLPTGEHTVGTFSIALDTELHLADQTEPRESLSHLQWAIESAVLDLALKQSERTLGGVLRKQYEPVTFVASPQLSDPPSVNFLHSLRKAVPDLEFKIDVPNTASESFLSELAATDSVRVLDLKGQYGSDVGAPADPELYQHLFETFPDAIIEDPEVTDATRDILKDHSDRVSWDAPITDLESLRDLPWEPTVINVKPCRFGTLESVSRFLDYALEHDIDLYGGGMFELDAGRAHNQALASLFYPDGPNDLAPPIYHQFRPDQSLPPSPLTLPESFSGIGWYSE